MWYTHPKKGLFIPQQGRQMADQTPFKRNKRNLPVPFSRKRVKTCLSFCGSCLKQRACPVVGAQKKPAPGERRYIVVLG